MWGAVAFVSAVVGAGLIVRGVFAWGLGFIAFAAVIAAWRIGREYPR